jgi:hypothetical protein
LFGAIAILLFVVVLTGSGSFVLGVAFGFFGIAILAGLRREVSFILVLLFC